MFFVLVKKVIYVYFRYDWNNTMGMPYTIFEISISALAAPCRVCMYCVCIVCVCFQHTFPAAYFSIRNHECFQKR